MNRVKILVIDNQIFFRYGISNALSSQPDLEVSECDPKQNPLSTIESNLIDVIFLSCDIPKNERFELCYKIRETYPNTKVVVISSEPNGNELLEAMKTGAAAYISKNATVDEIANISRRVARGEYPINENLENDPEIAGNVLRQFETTAKAIDGMAAPLTNRETQILKYIANGNSNKQIAGQLQISEQTIKNHISSILRKMNANDRAHAVVLAMRHGWIAVNEEQLVTAK